MNTYKEALEKIAMVTHYKAMNSKSWESNFHYIHEIATEALKEQTSEPSPSVEEKAEKEYPVKMEHYSNGIPNGMYGMCDSNYYSREAFIKGHQSALDSIEKFLDGTSKHSETWHNSLTKLIQSLKNL